MFKKIGKFSVTLLSIAMCAAIVPAWASEPDDKTGSAPAVNSSLLTIESTENPVADQVRDPESVNLRTIGKEDPDSAKLTLINQAGAPITYVCVVENDPESELYQSIFIDYYDYYDDDYDEDVEEVKEIQKELIKQGFLDGEADGSFGPMTMEAVEAFREKNGLSAGLGADDEMLALLFADYDDGNLLENGETIENNEKVVLVFPGIKADKEAAPAAADTAIPSENAATASDTEEITVEDVYPDSDYLMIVRFLITDEDNDVYEDEYVLHFLPSELDTEITLKLITDEYIYIEYTDPATNKIVSTKDTEAGILEYELLLYLGFDDDMFEIDWDDEDLLDDDEWEIEEIEDGEWIEDDEDWDDESWDDEDWSDDGDWDIDDWVEDESWLDDEIYDDVDEEWIYEDDEYDPESDPGYTGE